MNEIRLAPQYLSAVLNKSKTTTIRRGHRNFPHGPATIKTSAGDVHVIVTGVEHVLLNDLTTPDANADGFANLVELRNALGSFYSRLQDDEPMTIVRFGLS